LKKEFERLIDKGYLRQFLKKDFRPEQVREDPSQSITTLPKINVILGGTSTRGDSNNGKRKYRKQVLAITRSLVQWHEPIIFTLEE